MRLRRCWIPTWQCKNNLPIDELYIFTWKRLRPHLPLSTGTGPTVLAPKRALKRDEATDMELLVTDRKDASGNNLMVQYQGFRNYHKKPPESLGWTGFLEREWAGINWHVVWTDARSRSWSGWRSDQIWFLASRRATRIRCLSTVDKLRRRRVCVQLEPNWKSVLGCAKANARTRSASGKDCSGNFRASLAGLDDDETVAAAVVVEDAVVALAALVVARKADCPRNWPWVHRHRIHNFPYLNRRDRASVN